MFIFTPIYGDDAVEMVSVRFSCVSFGFTLSLSLSGLFFFSGSRPCGVDVDIGVSRCQRVIQKSKKKKKTKLFVAGLWYPFVVVTTD